MSMLGMWLAGSEKLTKNAGVRSMLCRLLPNQHTACSWISSYQQRSFGVGFNASSWVSTAPPEGMLKKFMTAWRAAFDLYGNRSVADRKKLREKTKLPPTKNEKKTKHGVPPKMPLKRPLFLSTKNNPKKKKLQVFPRKRSSKDLDLSSVALSFAGGEEISFGDLLGAAAWTWGGRFGSVWILMFDLLEVVC